MTPEVDKSVERATPKAEIVVADEAWHALEFDVSAVVERAVRAAIDPAAPPALRGATIDILLTSDAEVRRLNARYRKRDEATNVLSFPQIDSIWRYSNVAVAMDGSRDEILLGDVVLARETIVREADEQGKTMPDHLAHMVVHGVLHLLGYDHDDDRRAAEMEALEKRALAAIGVNDPYPAAAVPL